MSAAEEQQPGGRAPIGAILAGGLGSRLGGAKATAELAGRPLIAHAVTAVGAAGLEPLVVAKRDSELPPLDCPVLREPDQPRHPLCGIVAALRHGDGRPLVALGCDMPLLSASLLAWLAAAPEPLVVCSLDGAVEPLPGRYGGAVLEPLEAALAAERSLRAALTELRPRLLDVAELSRFGDPERLCFNVNTGADLRRAEELLASG